MVVGFVILALGVFSLLFIESLGPTIWIWYPWVGVPNPFWVLRPLSFLFVGFGGFLTIVGFVAKHNEEKRRE